MKNSVEITRKYQFGYMILAHIKAILICGVFEAVAFYQFVLGYDVTSQIFAGIFTVVYGFTIYSYARKLSLFDNKSYTPLKPSVKYGFLWGALIALSVALFIVLYLTTFGKGIFGVVMTIISYIWLAPYCGFINIGSISVWYILIMLIVPILASTLGYIAGNKKFDIVEKIDSLTFEKDDDEE